MTVFELIEYLRVLISNGKLDNKSTLLFAEDAYSERHTIHGLVLTIENDIILLEDK